MESKKNSKLTIKILKEELDVLKDELKELKHLKEKMPLIEKRLTESELKTKVLEEKINEMKNVEKTSRENHCELDISKETKRHCPVCEKSVKSKKDLKEHKNADHPQKIS